MNKYTSMKTLYTGLFVLVLAGCSTLTPRTFDAVEYNHYVELTLTARQASQYCDSSMASRLIPATLFTLRNKVDLITIYIAGRPQHKELGEALALISKQIDETAQTYRLEAVSPSAAYCKGKFKILDLELTRILNTVGGL